MTARALQPQKPVAPSAAGAEARRAAAASAGGSKTSSPPGLERLRAQIDAINVKLVRLLNQRAKVAQAIGHLKQQSGAAIYQPSRERAVLERVAALNTGPLGAEHLRRIFVEIISACTALEHPLRVAFLGPEHTYSHEAARMRFGSSAEFAAEPSIAAVFAALDARRADFGVVPVENSTEGSVTLTLDLLIDTPLVIIGEVLLPIRHALMSRAGEARAIEVIYSHAQSLGQCRNYLAANHPRARLEAVASNSAAAERAAGEAQAAAIASEAAAAHYGLTVVARNIQDAAHNTTRFLVIGHAPAAPSGADKTTALFAVRDEVGALNQALNVFARNRINISKIESRPLRARPWEYLFFVDLHGHREDPGLKRALAALERKALFLKVLGSYPEARPPAA
ncbi:MAG TPA: prephenate dehydratase [Candidatus Binataceae bacterium]|nr:prephenate dehydratase [Candidatus Binataceae bacterium]